MEQAYDVILDEAVKAESIKGRGLYEPFRYTCLCCGEEVYLAAAYSKKRSPHFRHKRGNGERECELYLGTIGIAGALNQARKRHHLNSDVFFDSLQKAIYISVSFSEEEIENFEKKNGYVVIRNPYESTVLESLSINRGNFVDSKPILFPVKANNNTCIIEIKNANIRSSIELLNPTRPTFFKPLMSYNKAKKISNGVIFTKTLYYLITNNDSDLQRLQKNQGLLEIENVERTTLIRDDYYVLSLVINDVSKDLIDLFSSFNYILKRTNEFSILWPPYYFENEKIVVNKNTASVKTSFLLKPNSNINRGQDSIHQAGDLYDLDIDGIVKIHDSNIDLVIQKKELDSLVSDAHVDIKYEKKVRVDGDYGWYLIYEHTYEELKAGIHWLDNKSMIIKYKGNQPQTIYKLSKQENKSAKARLGDVLRYYKVTVPYQEDLFSGIELSNIAESYIEECKISKTINKKVVELIKAGII